MTKKKITPEAKRQKFLRGVKGDRPRTTSVRSLVKFYVNKPQLLKNFRSFDDSIGHYTKDVNKKLDVIAGLEKKVKDQKTLDVLAAARKHIKTPRGSKGVKLVAETKGYGKTGKSAVTEYYETTQAIRFANVYESFLQSGMSKEQALKAADEIFRSKITGKSKVHMGRKLGIKAAETRFKGEIKLIPIRTQKWKDRKKKTKPQRTGKLRKRGQKRRKG